MKFKLLPLFRKYRVPLKPFLSQNGLKWGSSYHVVKAKIHVRFLSVRKQVLMQVFPTSEAIFRELSDSGVNLSGSPLLQLTWAGLVLLLAAKDTLLNATSSHDKVTLNFSVPFNKWQCLIHTVGSHCWVRMCKENIILFMATAYIFQVTLWNEIQMSWGDHNEFNLEINKKKKKKRKKAHNM